MSSRHPRRPDLTALAIARAGWGAVLLARPRAVLELLGGDSSDGVRTATRLLGARHLAEAALVSLDGSSPPPRWPTAIDLTHALSMLALARISPRLRRDALASATGALVLSGVSELERRRSIHRHREQGRGPQAPLS